MQTVDWIYQKKKTGVLSAIFIITIINLVCLNLDRLHKSANNLRSRYCRSVFFQTDVTNSNDEN